MNDEVLGKGKIIDVADRMLADLAEKEADLIATHEELARVNQEVQALLGEVSTRVMSDPRDPELPALLQTAKERTKALSDLSVRVAEKKNELLAYIKDVYDVLRIDRGTTS